MRVSPGKWALGLILCTLAIAYAPLLASVWHDSHTPDLTPTYVAQNFTDAGVYMAWITQAAEGHFLTRNLFAAGGPENHTVYLLFWVLGRTQALLHMPIGPFYGLITVLSGAALLAAAWWFTGCITESIRVRVAGLALICLTSGFGWAFVLKYGIGSDALPIDFQQPEAVTFSSLKTPLFALSQVLMLAVAGNLWKGMRDRSWRPLWVAIPCAALLANSHTYDIISLGSVWCVWLCFEWVRKRRVDSLEALQAVAVGLVAAIPAYLNYVGLRESGVFATRALVPTVAHSPWQNLAGLGLLVPLALIGLFGESSETTKPMSDVRRLLGLWVLVPLLLQYLPTSFQRKLIMGIHIPLALLAAMGLVFIVRRYWPAQRLAVAGIAALLPLSNLMITWQELRLAFHPLSFPRRELLLSEEKQSLLWLKQHAVAGAIIQPIPHFAKGTKDWDRWESPLDLAVPGYTGHSVSCGHWCETPDFEDRMDEWQSFVSASTDDADRLDWLRRSGVAYLVFSERDCPPSNEFVFQAWRIHPPRFLELIPDASTLHVQVYRVRA